LGIPGSGKSTISHRAAQILGEKGITIPEPTYLINNEMSTIKRYLTKSWYSLRLTWLRPAWALKWFWLVVQSRQRTLNDFVSMIINGFFVLEIYRHHSRNNDICFLDQGLYQALVSLSYHSKNESLIDEKLIAALDFVSTHEIRVIHVRGDVDTIAERLRTRDTTQSRLEIIKNTPGFVETIRTEKQKIETLIEILRPRLQTHIITLPQNDSEDIHSAVQQVAALIHDR
jgi:hypothetical protein